MFFEYKTTKVLSDDQKYTLMTDVFRSIDISPPKKICIVTDVNPDGIGDLMHQIQCFKVLHHRYPGMVDCITFAVPQLIPMYRSIVSEHQCDFTFYPLAESRQWSMPLVSETDTCLILQISWILNPQPALNQRLRHYYLSEIKYNHHPFSSRADMGRIGFLPECEGMWRQRETIAPLSILRNLSTDLQLLLGCPHFLNDDETERWHQSTWIASSGYYVEHYFLITLMAQLEYLQGSFTDITRMIVKYQGKDRHDVSWKLKDTLNTNEIRMALNKRNVRTLFIDDDEIQINQQNSLDVYLRKKYLSSQDYQMFQSLLNGCYFPSGDNSYCEAWSNPNTRLPPFPELRDYKQASILPLLDIIKKLPIDNDSRDWLANHIYACIVFHGRYHHANSISDILEMSSKLSCIWSSHRHPQTAWQALYHDLKAHDLNQRLIAIVKEQIFFSQHPECVAQKFELIKAQSLEPILAYTTLVNLLLQEQHPSRTIAASPMQCSSNVV